MLSLLPLFCVFLAVAFLAGAFLAVAFLATAFLAGVFLAAAFLAGAFLAVAFLATALAGVFLAAGFFVVFFFVAMISSFDWLPGQLRTQVSRVCFRGRGDLNGTTLRDEPSLLSGFCSSNAIVVGLSHMKFK